MIPLRDDYTARAAPPRPGSILWQWSIFFHALVTNRPINFLYHCLRKKLWLVILLLDLSFAQDKLSIRYTLKDTHSTFRLPTPSICSPKLFLHSMRSTTACLRPRVAFSNAHANAYFVAELPSLVVQCHCATSSHWRASHGTLTKEASDTW